MVTRVAILDDYHGLASSHFSKLDTSQYSFEYFPATLRPYHDEHTSHAERHELVQRLEPFEVIGERYHAPSHQSNFANDRPQLL
jgi:hypothetical protein